MKTVALLYHDVVHGRHFESSGFQGGDSDIYKLDVDQFQQHLAAIADVPGRTLITVDDGGASCLETIAPLLEAKQLHGYFFIPTNWIDRPGFLTRNQIRELRDRGHLVGSHSCSHPERISHCSWEQMCDEWKRSTVVLSEILGEPIQMASVPGGFYTPKVARAAAAAGIRTLFTSDPTTIVACVNGCVVVGRFMIQRNTSPQLAASLARGAVLPRLKQSVSWNAKKVLKAAGGNTWLRFRKWALS